MLFAWVTVACILACALCAMGLGLLIVSRHMHLWLPGYFRRRSATGPIAAVDFQGSRVDVSLALTPEAREGDWVLVHAGVAITVLDAAEAKETYELLAEIERLS